VPERVSQRPAIRQRVISRKLDDELIQNLRLSTGVETNAGGIVHHLCLFLTLQKTRREKRELEREDGFKNPRSREKPFALNTQVVKREGKEIQKTPENGKTKLYALTTSENTKHSAKMLESNASFNPIAVVNPTTSAVCDEGIPPLPTNLPQSTFPVVW
jgi:hypothetical protein